MLFERILVPYDGSKYALRAFKIALNMAKKYDSKLTLLTILNRSPTGFWYLDNRLADAELIKQTKAVRKEFAKLEKTAQKSGVNINAKIIESPVITKAIVNFAKTKKFSLLIIGSQGRTGLDKIVLGSVANGVVNSSRIPVLVVK